MNLTIVVPYQHREENLLRFVPHMERFLSGTAFRIVVIEQGNDKPCNPGALKNVGIEVTRQARTWYALHDVDMLPVDAECDYSRACGARHLAGAAEQFGFKLPYPNFLGGVVVCSSEAILSINGFSNQYWGWGLEDDDLALRLWAHEILVDRRPGRYRCLAHAQAPRLWRSARSFSAVLQAALATDDPSEIVDPRVFRRTDLTRFRRRPSATAVFAGDGLSTLSYRLLGTQPLYRRFDSLRESDSVHEIITVDI